MPYNRIVLEGFLGAGVENWSCGLNFATATDGAVSTPVDLAVWAEAIRASFSATNTWNANLKACWGSNGSLQKVKAYYYDSITGPAGAVGESTGGPVAGSGSLTMPPQCSVVASLLTGIAGRRTRGRIYWPRVTGSLDAGFKISGTPVPALLAPAFADFLEDTALASGLEGLQPVVVSKVGAGALTTVSSVSVGDIIDTQRRRRDKLVETRVTAAVVS